VLIVNDVKHAHMVLEEKKKYLRCLCFSCI